MQPSKPATSAGFVAILGAPNAGKSTLINRLVGAKVSIVTHKVQTTRRRIIGITMAGPVQIMFIDTPGIFDPSRKIEKAMVNSAWSALPDADLIIHLVDASKKSLRHDEIVLEGLKAVNTKKVLVLNKVDQVHPPKLLPVAQKRNDELDYLSTFMISALNGSGCDDLLDFVASEMPKGPWLYPEDQLSDLSSRALASEITQEKIFLQLNQELPYQMTVETEAYASSEDGKEIRIDQTIYVTKDTQKAIILGHKGKRVKEIGQQARAELEGLLDARVHLFIFVKVRKNWQDDRERYQNMGLDYPG